MTVTLIMVPLIGLIVDFVCWMEACHINGFFLKEDRRWVDPILAYFRMGGIVLRLPVLTAAIYFAIATGRSNEDSKMLGAITGGLFLVYVIVALWTFYKNLRRFYNADDAKLSGYAGK